MDRIIELPGFYWDDVRGRYFPISHLEDQPTSAVNPQPQRKHTSRCRDADQGSDRSSHSSGRRKWQCIGVVPDASPSRVNVLQLRWSKQSAGHRGQAVGMRRWRRDFHESKCLEVCNRNRSMSLLENGGNSAARFEAAQQAQSGGVRCHWNTHSPASASSIIPQNCIAYQCVSSCSGVTAMRMMKRKCVQHVCSPGRFGCPASFVCTAHGSFTVVNDTTRRARSHGAYLRHFVAPLALPSFKRTIATASRKAIAHAAVGESGGYCWMLSDASIADAYRRRTSITDITTPWHSPVSEDIPLHTNEELEWIQQLGETSLFDSYASNGTLTNLELTDSFTVCCARSVLGSRAGLSIYTTRSRAVVDRASEGLGSEPLRSHLRRRIPCAHRNSWGRGSTRHQVELEPTWALSNVADDLWSTATSLSKEAGRMNDPAILCVGMKPEVQVLTPIEHSSRLHSDWSYTQRRFLLGTCYSAAWTELRFGVFGSSTGMLMGVDVRSCEPVHLLTAPTVQRAVVGCIHPLRTAPHQVIASYGERGLLLVDLRMSTQGSSKRDAKRAVVSEYIIPTSRTSSEGTGLSGCRRFALGSTEDLLVFPFSSGGSILVFDVRRGGHPLREIHVEVPRFGNENNPASHIDLAGTVCLLPCMTGVAASVLQVMHAGGGGCTCCRSRNPKQPCNSCCPESSTVQHLRDSAVCMVHTHCQSLQTFRGRAACSLMRAMCASQGQRDSHDVFWCVSSWGYHFLTSCSLPESM